MSRLERGPTPPLDGSTSDTGQSTKATSKDTSGGERAAAIGGGGIPKPLVDPRRGAQSRGSPGENITAATSTIKSIRSVKSLLSLPGAVDDLASAAEEKSGVSPRALCDALRIMPGIDFRTVLWAMTSGCQGALLEAAARHLGIRPGDTQERVSPDVTGFRSVAQSDAASGAGGR